LKIHYSRYTFLTLCLTAVAMLVLEVAVFSGNGIAQSAGKEYTLKAAFIYNFTRYMQWDDAAADGDFIIGIIGDSDTQKPLEDIAAKRKVGDRTIKVVRFDAEEVIPVCHIVFIPAKHADRLQPTLAVLKSQPSLIVTEAPESAQKGAAINFVTIAGKVKFEMNITALERADITVSSKLKNIAILVDEL
jgi:hypothetical protein